MARPRESAVPTRGLATPRVGSQPDVVSCVVSQEIRVTAPRQARRTRVTGAMDGRIVPASSWMRKCASIFCLYIKVCSASVFTILAGRRLLPPGWCSPWDHSPVGFGLWFMWLFQRSPGFGHGGSVPALDPSAPSLNRLPALSCRAGAIGGLPEKALAVYVVCACFRMGSGFFTFLSWVGCSPGMGSLWHRYPMKDACSLQPVICPGRTHLYIVYT